MKKKLAMLFPFLSLLFPLKSESTEAKKVEIYPKKLDLNCGDGAAQIYDECGNQLDLLNEAIDAAHKQNKRVLMVYGAEWCIWDHVFNQYIQGHLGQFRYKFRLDGKLQQWDMQESVKPDDYENAKKLQQFVAENFVVVNIEAEHTNGKEVLSHIGMPEEIYYFPTIMVLDKSGKFKGKMPSSGSIPGFQIRQSGTEEYRGYDRKILLEQLSLLKAVSE